MSIFDHIDPDETVYASSQGETGPVDLDDPWGMDAPPHDPAHQILIPLTAEEKADLDAAIEEDRISDTVDVLASLGVAERDIDAMGPALRQQLIERVDEIAAAGRAAREARTGEVTRTRIEQLAPETRDLAEAEGALTMFAGAFQAAAKHAKGHLADLVVESLTADEAQSLETHGGSRSLRVGDSRPGAQSVRVTVTRSRQLWTDDQQIIDAVSGLLVERHYDEGGPDQSAEVDAERVGYANGVEAGIETVLSLLASPKFTVTKLVKLREAAEAEGRDGIARALGAAYGQKVRDGEPTVKIERVQDAIEGEAVSE